MKSLLPLILLLPASQIGFAFEPIVFSAAQGTPESQGWSKSGDLETKIATEDGHTFLDVDDESPEGGVIFEHKIDADIATEAGDAGFALEITARIEPTPGATSQRVDASIPTARVVLVPFSNAGKQQMGLISKGSERAILSISEDSDFHVWKIVCKPSGPDSAQVSYYCDGKPVTQEAVALSGAASHIGFGAMGGSMADRSGHVLYEKVVLRPLEKNE